MNRLNPVRWLPGLRLRATHARRALKMVWRAAPGLSAIALVLTLIQGLVPAAIVYTTKWVVDSVDAVLGAGFSADTLMAALVPAVAMALLVLIQQGLSSGGGYIEVARSEIVQDRIKAIIHAKAVDVDYAFYESDDYHDKLRDAHSQAAPRSLGLLQNISSLAQNLVAFSSIAIIIGTYAWWLPLALFGGAAPGLFVIVYHNQVYRRWWDQTMTTRRKADYYDHVTVLPSFAGEVRLYGFGPAIAEAYQGIRVGLRESRLALLRRQSVARVGASVLALFGLGLLMVWMLNEALEGRATIGDLALFYQAINQGQSIVRSLFQGVGNMYTNALFLEQLFSFLDLKPKLAEPTDPAPVPGVVRDGVVFDGVWFSYPGAQKPSLQGLNLTIPAGKVTAIVGMNGAGKSTLLKLLCRFYEADRGRVLIDGIDVRSMRRDDIYRAVNVLFQTPVRHQDTAWSNIALADMNASREAIVEAAKAAGAFEFIDALPRGFDSVLGQFFYEGAELSGGQWQRVALARAYLRAAPIVVLDEPTSAMDSWSEMDWFRRFRTLVDGRTAAVITHRFTVAMQADVIHVMDEGRVVESGTHRELLALDGRYAASWTDQIRRAEQAGRSPTMTSDLGPDLVAPRVGSAAPITS